MFRICADRLPTAEGCPARAEKVLKIEYTDKMEKSYILPHNNSYLCPVRSDGRTEPWKDLVDCNHEKKC